MAKNVLIVDDAAFMRMMIKDILTKNGYNIAAEAENGKIAVDMLEKSKPGYYQLILMDVQMPEMDGYEASKRIRALKDEKLSSIPIFAMTANAFEEDKQEALKSGMDGHIAKPIDIEKLFDTLSIALS